MTLCSLPLLWQHSVRLLEAMPVQTRLYWQDARKHPAWKQDPRSSPHPTRHALNGIWAWKKQRQLQSSAELFGGCSYSLIWQQSWEIIWISLVSVACLSGFSADRVPSGMFLCCVRVWVCGCRVWLDLFVLPFLVLLFPVVCMWGFCLGTRGGLVFVVKLEAPSLPQGWLLHSHCTAPLAILPSTSFPLPLTAATVMVHVCWSNTPTWVQQCAVKNWRVCHYKDTIRKVDWSWLLFE